MKVSELVTELQKFSNDIDVHIYASKSCDIQPIHRVHFQPGDGDEPAIVVLVDETESQADVTAVRGV
jgi:hypothetical protein